MSAEPKLWAIVQATRRRKISPTTMPRMPPDRFFSAIIRPMRNEATLACGISAQANSCANSHNKTLSCRLRNNGKRWSLVIPEGPAAAPFFDFLKLCKNPSKSKEKGARGLWSRISCGMGCRGSGGLRRLFLNDPKVAWSPGATASPSNASRAENNSPIVAKTRARSALRSTMSAKFRDLLDLATATVSETSRLADIKAIQRPWANCANLCRSLLFGIKLPFRFTNNIRGIMRNNFHPRILQTSLLVRRPSRTCSIASRTADTYAPSKNFGGAPPELCLHIDVIQTDQCIAKGFRNTELGQLRFLLNHLLGCIHQIGTH